jgi:hypothetical protein
VAVRRPYAVFAAVLALAFSVAVAATASAGTAAPPDPGGGQVWSEIRNADGSTSVTVYRAAQGVTAAALHASLRASGVPGLVDPAAKAAQEASALVACSYGRVDTLTCSPVRWHKRGFGDPQVYFRDSTSSGWPVSAAVAEWHRAVGADSYYQWLGSCPAASTGRHCVTVANEYGSSTSYIGRIQWTADANRYFVDGTVKVFFNTRSGPAEDYRSAVCNHLGHALGVGHNDASNSCMYRYAVSGPDPRYPNSDDFNLIRYVLYPD